MALPPHRPQAGPMAMAASGARRAWRGPSGYGGEQGAAMVERGQGAAKGEQRRRPAGGHGRAGARSAATAASSRRPASRDRARRFPLCAILLLPKQRRRRAASSPMLGSGSLGRKTADNAMPSQVVLPSSHRTAPCHEDVLGRPQPQIAMMNDYHDLQG